MEHTTHTDRKIDEALQLLNEAAHDKKEEFQKIFGDRFSHLKEALSGVAHGNKEILGRVKHLAEEGLFKGPEKFTEAFSDIDEQVHKDPWPYLGGVAAGALVLGFILGASKK